MRTRVRIFAIVTAVLVMALGAWGVAAAQRKGATSGSMPGGRAFTSSLLAWSARVSVAEHPGDDQAAAPDLGQSSSAQEDHPKQQVDDGNVMEPATPEPGDDKGMQNESGDAEDGLHEITGTVTAVGAMQVTIDGKVYGLAPGAEGIANLKPGAIVKVEFVTNPDGTLAVREIKPADQPGEPAQGDSSSDDSSVRHESGKGSGSDGQHHGGGDDGSDG